MREARVIRPGELRPSEAYRLMIAVIVPRPIAWVTSRSRADVLNAAPFSFFGGITAAPPIFGIGVGRRRDGNRKDTARNVVEGSAFVVHLCETGHLAAMVATSAEYPPEVSEPEELGLALAPSATIDVPGLALARVRMECVLERHLEVGDGPVDLLMGRVLAFRIDEALLAEDGTIREEALAPIGRLGGAAYAPVERRIECARPVDPIRPREGARPVDPTRPTEQEG